MTQLSKERLEEIKEFGLARIINPLSDDEILSLVDIALSAEAQEPVAWRWGYRMSNGEMSQWRLLKVEPGKGSNPRCPRIIQPLYAAPQVAQVPTFDEWLEIQGNNPLGWVKDAMRESYDACRAAMLAAAPQPEGE